MRRKLFTTLILIVTLLGSISAQQSVVTGTVTSAADGLSVPGVTVAVKGTTTGTVTDGNGQFSLSVPTDGKTLVFSFIGLKTLETPIAGKTSFKIALEVETIGIEDVVVTALGIKREVKALGYAQQGVSASDLSAGREKNISNMLTAKIAGVQVAKTAGGAGGSTNVIIRGNSSIGSNNQPLWVVDGIPIINNQNSSNAAGVNSGDHDYGDGVADINPDDIESMNVLKGPNAAALYGSRGANGVIMITTKSGAKKKKGIGVEINSNVAVDRINLIPTFQNKYASGYEDETFAYGWEETASDGIKYPYPENGNIDSWGPPLDGTIRVIDVFKLPGDPTLANGKHTTMLLLPQPEDNVKSFYETGISNTNNVAITSVSDKSTVRLSMGNTTTHGVIPNEKITRNTVTLRATTQATEYLSFDAKVSYIRSGGEQRPTLGYGQTSPVWNLAIMARFTPLDFIKKSYEETGSYFRFPGENYNPWYIVNEIKNNDHRDRVIGNVSTTLKITDWLKLMGRVGLDSYSEEREEIWPVGARGTDFAKGQFTRRFLNNQEINADAILTADKAISSSLSVSASLGTSILSQRSAFMSWTGRDLKSPGVYDISNANVVLPDENLRRKEIQSVFFMGQLGYKNYLFLDVTGRNDWSSTLGIDNYSFFYPSVSASFVFTDALKMDSKILNFGKLRASWSQVGNDAAPYLTTAGYSLSTTAGFNGNRYAFAPGTIPPLGLKNETTEAWEIGADLRFLNNRISLDATYYDGKTTDQILQLQIPVSSGYSNKIVNAGEIRNSGIEIALNLTPVKTQSFSWDINFNFAKNKSKVVELSPGIKTYLLINGDDPDVDIEARVGEPFGNLIGFAYQRAPDGQKIVNSEGVYIKENEKSVLGNINPDWIGGLNNRFSYKGFSMNFLLDIVQGGQMVSHTMYNMEAKGTGKFTEEGRRPKVYDDQGNKLPYVGVLDGVVEVFEMTADGKFVLDENKQKILTGYEKNALAVSGQKYWAQRAWGNIGEEFILDKSYIALREVMIDYSFKPSFMKKTPFETMNLSVFGRNLFYLEEHMNDMGIAPDAVPNTSAAGAGIEALAMPSTRTYGVNLKLTF